MDDPGAPTSSSSTAAPPAAPRRRGPVAVSCQACRHRRVKCVRSRGADEPCEQCTKKGIACTAVQLAPPAPRSGKRIESAKQLYGSLSSSSSSSAGALIPSGLSTRLADGEMSESLGLELLTLYGDAGRSCCQPLFPPPVLDYIALRDRYREAGRRLSEMSPEDQLIGRIVFATASRLWSGNSPSSAAENRPLLSQQLLVNAQVRADAAAVWRHPSPNNAVSLLLLYQLINRGEIGSEEAKPYLAALVGHLRALNRTNPELLLGASGSNTSALVWCLMAFDAFAAVERAEEPIVSDREYERLLRPLPIDLPSIPAVRFALQSDPWSLTNYLLVPLGATVDVGRRLARCLDELDTDGGRMTVARQMELGEVWERTKEVCSWGSEVLELGEAMEDLDIFTATVLHMYVSLAFGAAVFCQLAIVLRVEERREQQGTYLAQLQASFPQTAALYLRSIRVTAASNNFLTVFTGTAWSISRLIAFSQAFRKTSAWNPMLHPGGMTDKLSSLNFLHDALTSVARSYPSDELRKAIQALESEQGALHVILGTAASDALPSPAVSRADYSTASAVLSSLLSSAPSKASTGTPSTDTASSPNVPHKPSLIRISTWTHILDKEERPAVEYYGYSRYEGSAAGEKQPRPRRSPPDSTGSGGSGSTSGGAAGGRGSGDSPPGAPPGVTWADLGFDYRPASSAGSGGGSTGNSPPSFPPSAAMAATGSLPPQPQAERGACAANPLQALAFFSNVDAAPSVQGGNDYLSGVGLKPFPSDFLPHPPPSASTASSSAAEPQYHSFRPSPSGGGASSAVLDYTSLPPGTTVYPFPPTAPPPAQPPQPVDLSSAFTSSSAPYPLDFPSVSTPSVHLSHSHFSQPAPLPSHLPPSSSTPFYASPPFPTSTAAAAPNGAANGGEADFLASFLATLVDEAGASSPAAGDGGTWAARNGDEMEGVEEKLAGEGGEGGFEAAQLFFS